MTRPRLNYGFKGHEAYERYGQPGRRARDYAALICEATRDGDQSKAQAALDQAFDSLRHRRIPQTSAPSGDGTDRGRPAADRSTP